LALLVVLVSGCLKAREPARATQQARASADPAVPTPSAERPATAESPGQLARVRPPSEPCLEGTRRGTVEALVTQASSHYRLGEHERALACAEEALRAAPRSVPALHYRATALTALGRLEEAKLAFARALAVDPDDAETLHGAADLYVARLGGEREGLLIGQEYALRGARLASGAKPPDPDLAARLLLLAAMAENDLGDSPAALEHADRAIRSRPSDANLHYERGVALYELCRFDDARAALLKANALAPDDPWTLHYLGLVEEHGGNAEQAEKLLASARRLSPADFSAGIRIGRADFDEEVRRAIALLPAHERKALATVPLELADVPALDYLTAVDPPLSPTILGLFRGPPEAEPCDGEAPCRSIVLYRRNLARFARDRAHLAEQLRVTLLHELGHLHGESDDELRARGLE
jgi:Flp pilus assembly protein TadD/predicted Zn-dependent protease with MMP-like domain